jgi:Transposase zinc-binding domain
MDRPKLEVADVFRRYGEAYRQEHGASLSIAQRRVMTAIEVCRTAVLGGHLEQCDHCGHQRNAYNSCGDRHCPKCQSFARFKWLEERQAELLNTQYFHVVFTLPQQIATIAYQNRRGLYGILFRATAQTSLTIAADPKHLGEGCVPWIDRAIELVRPYAGEITLRGDTDYTLSSELDRWDSQGIKFIFGMDAHPKVVQLAEALPQEAWKPLERLARYEIATEPRRKPQRIKEAIVRFTSILLATSNGEIF